MEIQLKFLNMNESVSKITLMALPPFFDDDEDTKKKLTATIEQLPKDQFVLESSDIVNDFAAN